MFNVNTHSSIQIDDLYFDPYGIIKNKNDARFVFITHTHYDHLSIESLKRVVNDNTIFVATKDANHNLNHILTTKLSMLNLMKKLHLQICKLKFSLPTT